MSLNKNVNERQRFSTESSRVSFSSSCSSTLSSLDCNKTAQPETSSFDRIMFPETPSRDPEMNHPSNSPHLGRQSLNLRDVVKDSMYRESKGLSVKTTTREEAVGRAAKHRDSPRPLQLSKPVDGSCGVGVNMKQNAPVDLKDSLKAPWYYNESKELPTSSYEAKDASWSSISRDAPRFSYDGREINRLSFESRENLKSTTKLKELPRLSLDSRECSLRSSNSDSRPNRLSKNFQNGGNLNDKVLNLPQSSETGTQKRPPSVVAKLMGLETLPDSALASDSQLGLIKTYAVEGSDPFSKSLRTNELNRAIRISMSPRNSTKDPTSPRWRNSDFVMKPSSSRLPIEPAPWKQLDGNRGSQKPAFRPVKVPPREPNPFSSVYNEIEKRLNDLEFKQSGKDLRALKQILEAMQSKGLLETRKEEEASNFGIQRDCEPICMSSNQNSRSLSKQNSQTNHVIASPSRASNSSRSFESPIVIIKPAKLVEGSGIPALSAIPIDGISGRHKIQTAKDQSPKNSCRNSDVSSTDKKANGRNMRSTQSPSRSQQLPKENATSSVKSSGSVSPRLQQKKLEMEKRSRPPTPPSDSNKPRRQSNRKVKDSGSPGGKVRPKSSNLQLSDDQLSEISNDSRSLSCQGDDISVQSDSNTVLDSKIDIEVTSTESFEINGSQSPSMKDVKFSGSGSMQKVGAFDHLFL
jgi:hypothetical protein